MFQMDKMKQGFCFPYVMTTEMTPKNIKHPCFTDLFSKKGCLSKDICYIMFHKMINYHAQILRVPTIYNLVLSCHSRGLWFCYQSREFSYCPVCIRYGMPILTLPFVNQAY